MRLKARHFAFALGMCHQFRIVRGQDVGTASASTNLNLTADQYTTARYKIYRALRRVLRVEDYYVDLNNMAVVDKASADHCCSDTSSINCNPQSSCSTATCAHWITTCSDQSQ